MIGSEGLGIILAAVMTYLAFTGLVDGAKWVGHEAKRGGAAVVHVLKKLPHPHAR